MAAKVTAGKSRSRRDSDAASFGDWDPDLLKARVYEQILLDIILGELAPGARLEERSLAKRYGAGLAGVRDALSRLALEGLVIRKARSGTAVAPLDLMEVRQALEARRLIEPHCAALAALNATDEDIAAMRAAFRGAASAAERGDARALVGMDQRFHAALARASRNVALARIVIPLQHQAARFWVFSMAGDAEAKHQDDIDEHLALIELIAAGDADAARGAMLAILGVTSDELRNAAESALRAAATITPRKARPI